MNDLKNHMEENRPWGTFERFTLNERSTVKITTIKPGEALSLQTHKKRSEFWRIIRGNGKITVGNDENNCGVGDSFFVPADTPHRAEAGEDGLSFLEITFGDFNEDDIVRIEDRYGRETKKQK